MKRNKKLSASLSSLMFRFFIPLLLFIALFGCELKEEKIDPDPEFDLLFSTDTVIFDTLLSERASITKRLRVFNPNARAVEISRIRLGNETDSEFQMIVNGQVGASFENEVLFGKDSLLILVEVTIDPRDENLPFLVKDSVIFEWNQKAAHVKFIAWGQDANYLGRVVLCDTVFSPNRPYVFYDTVVVDQNCHLQVEPGTQLFFDRKAALLVLGRLTVNGDSGNQVVFRNSRFDQDYIEAPGQWPGIFFVQGSDGNLIDHAIIENAITGITIGTPDEDTIPDLIVDHTIIRHHSISGIQAFTSDILGRNLLIHNAGQNLLFNVAGGNYQYEHCTFVNSPSFFFAEDPAVQFADFVILSDGNQINEDLSISLINNIIWGNTAEELLIASSGIVDLNINVENNIIKSESEWNDNFVSIDDEFPGFLDPGRFDYRLDSTSFSIGKGITGPVMDDLLGRPRDGTPDLGAYEYTQ